MQEGAQMTFNELITAMGKLLGLEDFTPDEDGFCTLESKDGVIDIAYVPEVQHGVVLLHAVVKTAEEEMSGAVIRHALEINCGLRRTRQATLSVNPETGSIELARFFSLELLDPEVFLMLIENFAATLVEVRELLKEDEEEFTGLLEEGKGDANSVSPSDELDHQGFLRV